MTGRPVRYVDAEAIAVDIVLALPDPSAAQQFIAVDLAAALAWLAAPGRAESLERGGPWIGGRLVVEPGQTVGAFNLFADLADDGIIVILGLDIWPRGFPLDPDE